MDIKELRSDCWNKSLHTFGYSYIFNNRAFFYGRWIRITTLLGVIVPLTIGATATGYGTNSTFLSWLIWVSIPLSIIQVGMSAISLVNKWEDQVSYSFEAINDYNSLSDGYKKLALFPPDEQQFIKYYDGLETRLKFRSENDVKFLITDRERRKGMRWGLREFRRKCVACDIEPTSMISTDCDVCGNYKMNYLTKYFNHG